MFPKEKAKKQYAAKLYGQMTHAGERIQPDVKIVPRRCIADPKPKLFQDTAIDKFTRLRFLYAYSEQSAYTSAGLQKALSFGISSVDSRSSACKQTTVWSISVTFQTVNAISRCFMRRHWLPMRSIINTSVLCSTAKQQDGTQPP